MLQDMDRPIIEREYEPWGRMVKLRVLSAGQFSQVMGAIAAAGDDDNAAKIAAMSRVCAMGILDPEATADEWRDQVTIQTLTTLGNWVIESTSKASVEEAKKN